jgi:phosphodiesterase/alkaline phosphatase D-like protein
MTPTEPNTEIPSRRTGCFAALRGFLGVRGSGAPAGGQRRSTARGIGSLRTWRPRRITAICAPIAVGLLLTAAVPGIAAESDAPTFQEGVLVSKVQASQADVEVTIANHGFEDHWTLETSTSEEGGPWVLVASGTQQPHRLSGEAANAVIHHLNPQTRYFARFKASTVVGEVTSETASFTTLAVGPPEIAELNCEAELSFHTALAQPSVMCGKVGPASAKFFTELDTDGAETKYRFESATSPGGPFTPVPGASGVITVAEDFARPEASLSGLSPETSYYLRLIAENGHSPAAPATIEFATLSARPDVTLGGVRSITGTSAKLEGSVIPRGSETHWHFEYATEAGGPWTSVSGGGTITAAEAGEESLQVTSDLAGLSAHTKYYFRLFAENECATGCGGALRTSTGIESFETSGLPAVTTFATHSVQGESLRVLGAVTPNNSGLDEIQTVTIDGAPTGGTFTLTSGGRTTVASGAGDLTAGSTEVVDVATSSGIFEVGEPITGPGIAADTTIVEISQSNETAEPEPPRMILSRPATASGTSVVLSAGLPAISFDATASVVQRALVPVLGVRNAEVTGPPGGPYTVEFLNEKASSSQPLLEADASGLTPSGSVAVAAVQDGFNYEVHYHFEYIPDTAFKADGGEFGPGSQSGPEVLLGGTEAKIVAVDLLGLLPGGEYHYRLVATNTTPGDPVVRGAGQTLTVPAPAPETEEAVCPNQATRAGASAHLPDCRAYEQISPVDKEGAQEALKYGGSIGAGVLVGEDGDHLMYMSKSTRWGTGPNDGQAPYLLSRTTQGWQMTAGSPQPETGVYEYTPRVFNPDLTQFGFAAGWDTEGNFNGSDQSPDLEFKVGPLGGPYATAAAVPRKQVGGGGGWVAASEDFSKLILAAEDRKLVEPQTTTKSGDDLYEYANGELRQVNVGVGVCGARIVEGAGELGGGTSSRHAVSSDGSRVFFEAVPGAACEGPMDLYVRTDGTETKDIGAYRFLAADAAGSRVLLEKRTGETREVLLYETESGATKALFSTHQDLDLKVSEDLGTIYLISGEQLTSEAPSATGERGFTGADVDLYRYDVATGALSFIARGAFDESGTQEVSPDGRYDYIQTSAVAGVPGGATTSAYEGSHNQLYRYDSAENVIECVSCASPFNPEPRLGIDDNGGILADGWETGGVPHAIDASVDGNYAFFETPSALLPADVDGEIPFGRQGGSPSNDIYEWRRYGLHGCVHLQGCVSLITPGTDGYLVVLVGASDSGQDVFFYTSSQLVPADNDTAGDFYDARVEGGFAEPTRPVECEGDSCSTPFSAPNDLTPSSATFQGAGNVVATAVAETKARPKKHTKGKPKGHTKPRKKAKKAGKHARKASHDRRAGR